MTTNISKKRCGYVAIIGAANVGKSTLLNKLVGRKIAIVTHKAQTTRQRVLGIKTQEDSQLIFVDTPGIFAPKRALDHEMIKAAWSATHETDILMVMIDVTRKSTKDVRDIIKNLGQKKVRVALILNKIDLIKPQELLDLSDQLNRLYPFERTFMISALKEKGLKDILKWVQINVPEGPWLYPENQLSDLPERMFAAEIIREKLFLRLHQELPYHLTVHVSQWKELGEKGIRIEATIYIEREAHRPIILGEKGITIKKVGMLAREELSHILNQPVHLFLFVKVAKDWSKNIAHLKHVGLEKF